MLEGVRQPQQPQPKPTSAERTATQGPAPASGSAPSPAKAGDTSAFEARPTTQPAAPALTGDTQGTGGAEPSPAKPPAWSFSATINADRAKATRDALTKYAAADEVARARLTGPVIDALVSGVSTPRTESVLGQEGVLGRRQAMEAAKALVALPQPAYDRVAALLDAAGKRDGAVPPGASPDTERALILKAVAARTLPLGNADSQEKALGELEWFAGEVRGLTRDEVIGQTSAIDVDDRANTSQANPLDQTVTDDRRTDNDGYAQRFTASCSPAVAAMVRAEADPVFALMLGRDGLQNPDPAAGASQMEKQVLERDRFFDDQSPEVQLTPEQLAEFQKTGKLPPGVEHLKGSAVSRVGEQARKVMDEKLDEAVAAGKLTKAQADALRKDAQGGKLAEPEVADRDAALKAVRDASDQHPTDFELKAMRSDRPREKDMLIAHALRDLSQDVTNNEYWDFNVGKSLSPAFLNNVERSLANGIDLPIRLSTPGKDGGHTILFTDVRNQDGQREFLASDPFSGRTAWLTESDLTNPKSDWPRREFNVYWQQVTDVFAPLDFVKPNDQ